MSDRRVLLIDDNDDHRNWLATKLRELGWDVIATRGGRHALELAAESKPAVVLTELVLPDVRGMQLARSLRTIIEDDVTIIALTRLPEQLHAGAIAAGFDHVQRKPIKLGELQARMLTPHSASSATTLSAAALNSQRRPDSA